MSSKTSYFLIQKYHVVQTEKSGANSNEIALQSYEWFWTKNLWDPNVHTFLVNPFKKLFGNIIKLMMSDVKLTRNICTLCVMHLI